MDDEEKNKAIKNQLKKDLNLSDADLKEVTDNIEKRKYGKETRRKIRISLISLLLDVVMVSFAMYVAVTEKNTLYWILGFIFIGLATMEILLIRRMMHPEKNENKNPVKYCAQITSASESSYANVRKQNLFSSVTDAKTWIEKTSKDGESGRIIDTANGKIIGMYDRRLKDG